MWNVLVGDVVTPASPGGLQITRKHFGGNLDREGLHSIVFKGNGRVLKTQDVVVDYDLHPYYQKDALGKIKFRCCKIKCSAGVGWTTDGAIKKVHSPSSRYKVLPLSFPYSVEDEDIWKMMNEISTQILKPIEPVFNRPGWYYDRFENKSWVECKYGCWEDLGPESFLYEMSNRSHKVLNRKVIDAINVLIAYNMCPKELKKKLRKDQEVRMIKNTYWRSLAWRLNVIGK